MPKKLKVANVKSEFVWPTYRKNSWPDGRVQNVDDEMWLYRSVPLGPVEDARTLDLSAAMGDSLLRAFNEVAKLSGTIRLTRRATAKSAMRDVHILLVNVPRLFTPGPGNELADYHRQMFPNKIIDRRVLLFGVRLVPREDTEGIVDTINSVVETLVAGGDPIENFTRDARDVSDALGRAGFRTPDADDLNIAEAWWNNGGDVNVPVLPHVDHMHIFKDADAADSAARFIEANPDVKCVHWPDMAGQHTVSFATAREFFDSNTRMNFIDAVSTRAHWASGLVKQGAVAISMRGKVEPTTVTRDELRRMRKKYVDDINERYQQNKMSRSDQEEMLQELADMEAFYAAGGTATLIESSTVVAFTGRWERSGYDPTEVGRSAGITLTSLNNLQYRSMAEMMVASNIRVNPYLRDLPSQTIAYSGLPNLSRVGDKDGALVGFTEHDGQPAYLHPMAATDEDSAPLMVVIGQTGSGKSMSMNWFADQFAKMKTSLREKTPIVMFDPKTDSDFSAVARMNNGTVHSLDDLMHADGAFDGLRFSQNVSVGVETTHSTLMAVNPWGTTEAAARWETPLMRALNYGAEAGARCTMRALDIARRDGAAPAEMVDAVHDLLSASPMFAALCGRSDDSPGLSAAEGITYIKVGQNSLNLPEPGAENPTLMQRIPLSLVRNVVYGSMSALSGREGVILLDEAWVFTGAGRAEMERLGRLARSMKVFPMLFTQRVTDALNAGLTGYISRGLILPITDPEEAVAACKLFRLEPTQERLERITARGTLGDEGSDDGAPNWDSMRALRDPSTREVLRGTIGIYADLAQRAVPTEIVIPKPFLDEISTNRLDAIRRTQRSATKAPKRESRLLADGGADPFARPELPGW